MTASSNENNTLKGIVYRKAYTDLFVYCGSQSLRCTLPDVLFRQMGIAVGDEVLVAEQEDGSGRVTAVQPRRSRLSRRAAVSMPTAHAGEQLLAANIDQLVAVFAVAEPTPKWNMLDRYLAAAEANGVKALVCITKTDLLAGSSRAGVERLELELADYLRIGYPVLRVCARNGAGIAELRRALAGRVSALAGKSGVGKSSLLNAVQPGLGLRVSAVNATTGKGRHTTTALELFPLEAGGAVVDTPGEREFGLWDIPAEDLALLFREINPFVGRCRFGLDCAHDEEPGCAVRKAVMNGQISPRRYQSYLRLRREE